MPADRQQWLTEVLRVGLETRIVTERDILAHVTPAMMIGALPPDVIGGVLDAGLSTGAMSPKGILDVVTPELLASHIDHGVLWDCVTSCVEGTGIPLADAANGDAMAARELLRRVLASGLATGVLVAADIVRHVNANVIAHHFPGGLTTKLLEVSLASGKLNPELVLETLGPDAIAAHAPTSALWACIAQASDAARRPSSGTPAPVDRSGPVSGPARSGTAARSQPAAGRTPSTGVPRTAMASRASAPALEVVDDDDVVLAVDPEDITSSTDADPAAAAASAADRASKGSAGRFKRT